MSKNSKRILIVAAHPDDEVLGAGGTMARLAAEGHELYTLLLGDGESARYVKANPKLKKDIGHRKSSAYKANKALGVKEIFLYQLPDNRFDSVPLLDVVKIIEKVKNEIKPEIIFTHYADDLNVDHQITAQAVVTAPRPMPGEAVREIYAFEILSSTEWNFPVTFAPDVFYDISGHIKNKIAALGHYKREMREFPHPRSIEGVKIHAQDWGMKIGVNYAEAFKTIRCIR